MLLYTHPLSANAHKVTMLMGYLGLTHEERIIDIPGGEQREAPFLAITSLGQIPVLIDGDVKLRDAQAILVYIAGRYDPARTWWPANAAAQGRIAQWLAFAALELQNGINLARLHYRLGAPCDLEAAKTQGEKTLELLEEQLTGQDWLEEGRPTIADCACAPFAARSSEARHDLSAYPRVLDWTRRLTVMKGFPSMEGYSSAAG